MHRIATLPGEENSPNDLEIIEQPKAPVLFLTTATTDISTISSFLQTVDGKKWNGLLRAVPLTSLTHQSQIDHYLHTTADAAKIIIVRLLGGKGHWPYGLNQLTKWQEKDKKRILIILSGINENEIEFNDLSSINSKLCSKFSELIRIGGIKNVKTFFDCIDKLLNNQQIVNSDIVTDLIEDPYKWDWKSDKGPKVGIILYTSSYQSDDIEIAKRLNRELRKEKLCPRCLFVSSLKDVKVQTELVNIFLNEKVTTIISSTSFATVTFEDDYTGNIIWDKLNIPIFQMLICSNSFKKWYETTKGLEPIDFSLQIVLPELDGRITTRIIGFKEVVNKNKNLSTSIIKTKPYNKGIAWLIKLIKAWINLSQLENRHKKIVLVVSNYPNRDGRIANGVGLDTPSSVVNILKWLSEENYYVGDKQLPINSNELMGLILSNRTNSPESQSKPALGYVPLEEYLRWWNGFPNKSKNKIESKWDKPVNSKELEADGFAIHGVKLGNICILIQPSRGYNEDNIDELHSPYLPPSHRYLAQYLWISKVFKADCMVHVGKHGSVEWLPGKSVGLSQYCFPHLAVPPIPYIYPFIVNDPGEGSQAKRRTQSVIIDHLTPPLSNAGLYGELLELESLIEEYNESISFQSDRSTLIEERLKKIINNNNITILDKLKTKNKSIEFKESLDNVESYLCELKETQIRVGLHILGSNMTKDNLKCLILSISKNTSFAKLGLSEAIVNCFSLKINPHNEELEREESAEDISTLNKIVKDCQCKNKSDLIELVNNISKEIIEILLSEVNSIDANYTNNLVVKELTFQFINQKHNTEIIRHIKTNIISNINQSVIKEKQSILSALNGKRVSSGPSGAPTRGKTEVLPTGRNFFSVDLRGIPTEASWDLGKRSAINVLNLFLLENGNHLRKLAISIWGTATMRNGGEDISQILFLLGIMPVWDSSSRRVIDLEVIPTSILDRPRVDVTIRISGLFRDAFPQSIDLINKSIDIVSNLDEPNDVNPLAQAKRKGFEINRIFGSAPETYGTGIQELIDYGNWSNMEDLSYKYLSWSNYLYKDGDEPIRDPESIKNNLKDVQLVLHNQDNREHDILDSDDYYQFHGGLSSLVESLSGKKPNIYLSDNSKYSNPKTNTLVNEIEKVVRSRLLNPKWIKGMMKHGYKGSFEFTASLDYLFAYDATTNTVPNWCYRSIKDNWLSNNEIKAFLNQNNPWALRDIAERLLEASNRSLWTDITGNEKKELKDLILNTEREIETVNYKGI